MSSTLTSRNTRDPLDKTNVDQKIVIPALEKPFKVSEHLQCYQYPVEGSENKLRIAYLGSNLVKNFWDQEIQPRESFSVSGPCLKERADNKEVLESLGSVYEVDLAAVYYLLTLQPQGQHGFLLNNSVFNLFYIPTPTNDRLVVLRARCVSGHTENDDPKSVGAWGLFISSVVDKRKWHVGQKVIRRDPMS